MEVPVSIVQAGLRWLKLDLQAPYFALEPFHPHFKEDVFDPGPMSGLPITPFLMDSDNRVQALEQVFFVKDADGLAESRNGRFAILLALAAADVDLKALDLAVIQDGCNPNVMGAELDAIIVYLTLRCFVEVNRREADFKFPVQQVSSIFKTLVGRSHILRVNRDDGNVSFRGKAEISSKPAGHCMGVVKGRVRRDRAANYVPHVVAASV